ncbi:MAG: PQQ-binding-like beta-propeller repeat protein [Pseudomonadota bacterium]|nr:PQQ-binding-like beta-propeller repeat protein [Pseudomonadota bacterium]
MNALVGCDNYFGKKEKPPLPGERISILIHQQFLQPDLNITNKEILLPRPTPNDEWPQAGGYPNHAMHHIQINSDINEIWSANIGSGTDDDNWLISQPILAGGMLFTMDSDSEISAFDADNGKRIWKTNVAPKYEEESHIGGGLAYAAGKLYITTGFSQVISIDAQTGKVLWQKALEAPFRIAPTVHAGRLYVITIANKLYALNSSTGETIWTHSGIEESTNFLGGANPAVDSGVVVAAFSSGEVAALKVENGMELWRDSLAARGEPTSASSIGTIRGRPIIDRGIVFVVSNNDQLVAINLRTGRRIWDRNIGSIETPWVAGNFVFVLSNSSELVALSRQTGKIYWVTPLWKWKNIREKSGLIGWTGPVLASDRLIVANTLGEVLSVSPYSGQVLGQINLSDGVSISPIVARGTIYFLSEDAELIAYR